MEYSDGAIDGIIDRIQRTNYDHYGYNGYSIAGNARSLARDLGAGDARGSYTGDVADRVAELLTACREEIDRLRSRAIPDGAEWPRFDDGAPVRFGEDVANQYGEAVEVDEVSILDSGLFALGGRYLSDGCGGTVLIERGGRAHRPAIAEGGGTIEACQTVYLVDGGAEVSVERVIWHMSGNEAIEVSDSAGKRMTVAPSDLTHELPDSWDRLEADAADEAQRELVRRARALAEGGRHE